jgi:hypothetical protein
LKKTVRTVTGGENVKALEASCIVSCLVAKSGVAASSRAMAGAKQKGVGRIQTVASEANVDSLLYTQGITCHTVKIVNFWKGLPLNARPFRSAL